MCTITADLEAMFAGRDPWDCSNNEANLGPAAGRLTWASAQLVATEYESWLKSPLAYTCDAMRDWAVGTGAWERVECDAWSAADCLALFVQCVAGDLRDRLDADNRELSGCVALYRATDWESASDSPTGHYYMADGPMVDYYTGS